MPEAVALPKSVALPDLPAGNWLAVYLQGHHIAGRPMWAVIIRGRGGKAPTRDWFSDLDQAYSYALSQADARALPFFDQTDGGAE